MNDGSNLNPQSAISNPKSEDGDALTLLLEARHEDGTGLSQSDLLGHLSTLFTAGHETTASALTWTLFLLSQHPDIMHDLMDDLDSNLKGEAPTLEQLKSLPLLENVVNEGLRMFPPGMWIFRTAVAPFELGKYSLSAGLQLVFSPTATHYRPDIYANPNVFDPRRWETIQPATYEYIPFGGGPRRCLGAIFALLEMKLALAIILQRWRLEVPYRHKVDRGGTILSFPKDGLPVTLRPQDRRFAHSAVQGNVHDLVNFQWASVAGRR
jgi:cytochrome P450